MDGAEGICAAHRQEVSFLLSGDAEQPLRLCACTGNVLSTLLRNKKAELPDVYNQKVLLYHG